MTSPNPRPELADTGVSNRVKALPGVNVNKTIIATTLVIMAVGIVHAWTAKPPQGITKIVLGGYILMLVLSIFDMFGGPLADLTRAIALLAMVSVLLLEGVPILQQAGVILGGSVNAASTGAFSPFKSTTTQQNNSGRNKL